MPITPKHAFKERSTKLLILLLLRTIYNRTFQYETPCTCFYILDPNWQIVQESRQKALRVYCPNTLYIVHIQCGPSMTSWSIHTIFCSLYRGAFCQITFRWIYYYGSNTSTRKETGKTHLCAVVQSSHGPIVLHIMKIVRFQCSLGWGF